jgi:hypothetical protein
MGVSKVILKHVLLHKQDLLRSVLRTAPVCFGFAQKLFKKLLKLSKGLRIGVPYGHTKERRNGRCSYQV